MKELTKSWRTTLFGLLQFLGVVAAQVATLFDNLPETNPEWSIVFGSLMLLLGLAKARDNSVSSEDAGAKTSAQEGELAERVRSLEMQKGKTS